MSKPQQNIEAVLSQRQFEIYQLLADGHDPREISRRLAISTNTTKAHLSSIYRQLGVENRFAAINLSHNRMLLPERPMKSNRALTRHEMKIINLIAQGLGNKEVARELNHSYNTTRAHLRKIFRKLEVSNRFEAVKAVRSLNLVPKKGESFRSPPVSQSAS